MNGYERIKSLYLNTTNRDKSLIEIVKYLMQRNGMSDLYLNEEKNLDEMMKFINKKAKEQAVNNVAVILDDEVYQWAIEYFSKSNEELGLTKKPENNKVKEESKEDKDQLKLEI